MYEIDFRFVDKFSAASHAFEQKPYHFYSKIGIKMGGPENFINS